MDVSRRGKIARLPKSLTENWEGCCGEGFWLWARRRGPRIPAAGCKGRANEAHRQKTRCPEGFQSGSKGKVSQKVNKSVGQKAGLCSDVSALRRGDHRAERLKLEQARLERE
jgi:hypothetical protein